MLTEDKIVPSTEEPIPVAAPETQEQAPEEFPEAAPDSFVEAEEDIPKEEETSIGIPADYEIPDESTDEPFLGGDVSLPPPAEPPLPPKDSVEAKEISFYATEELGLEGEEAEAEFAESANQLIVEGRSDLEDTALEVARESEQQTDQMAVESIISDASMSSQFRQQVLQTYLNTGLLPTTLKDRYINKITQPKKGYSLAEIAAQDDVLEKVDRLKTQLKRNVREAEVKAVGESTWDEIMVGVELTGLKVGRQIGFDVTEQEIHDGMAERDRIMKKGTGSSIAVGVGEIIPLLGGGIAAGLATPFFGGGFLLSLGAASAAGGSIDYASHYQELKAEGVEEEIAHDAALMRGGLTAVEFALPIVRSSMILKRMMFNGAGEMAIGEVSVATQNAILAPYPELQQEQLNATNLTVNGLMGVTVGLVLGRRNKVGRTDFDDDIGVPPSSVAEAEKFGNGKEAAKDAAEIIGTGNNKKANVKAGGKTAGAYIADWVNPKTYRMTDGNETPLHPDAAAESNAWAARSDAEIKELFADTRYDAYLQDADLRKANVARVLEVRADMGGPKYNQPNSMINGDLSAGQDIYTPRSGGVYKTVAGANQAMKKLEKSIESSGNSEIGELGLLRKDGGFVIAHEWKFNYDPLSVGTLGVEKVTVLGIDFTGISRSRLGDFLFPTGRHQKMEGGAFRAIERKALIKNTFAREFHSAVRGLTHKKEFDKLIREAEELGKDNFTLIELKKMYPHLKRAEIEAVAVTWSKWRRVIDQMYNFTARQDRMAKEAAGFRGVYAKNEGKSIGLATDKIDNKDLVALDKDGSYVWDYATDTKIKYNKAQFEKEGKTIVRPYESLGGKGESFEFGVVGGTVKLNHLPAVTLPKVEGWSPRHVKENIYVDMHPASSHINGHKVTDQAILYKKLKTTPAAARTWEEAEAIAEQLRADNPDMVFTPRRERMHRADQLAEAMKVNGEALKESKHRGDKRLQSLNGEARYEDRFVSMQRSINSIAQTEAFTHWDIAVQKSFMDRYGELLDGEFPSSRTDIKMRGEPSLEKEKLVKEALRNFDYYANQKQMKTYGDFNWESFFIGTADIFESWDSKFISKNAKRDIPDLLRRLGDQGNLLTTTPKSLGSVLYIHVNIPRQHIIQPAQVREMWMVAPKHADVSFKKAQAMRFMISTMDEFHHPSEKVMKILSDNKLSGLSRHELLEEFTALKKSGLLDSLDRNELVRDVVNDSQKMLMESGWQKTGRRIHDPFSKSVGVARKMGFDAGEMTNRLGMWYQAKSLWQQQNPKLDWRTARNQEIIALEGVRLSGGMSRAGSLPYQRGSASVMFQFMAIGHKLTMNTIQSNATIMTPKLRSQLAAARLTAYGFHAGLPAAALLAYTYDLFGGEPLFDDSPESRRVLEHGVMDYVVNNAMSFLFDQEGKGVTDLSISESLSPYNEYGLPYIGTAVEWFKLIDGDQRTNPRFPIVAIAGSLGTTVNNIQSMVHVQDMSSPELLGRAIHEVALLGSGYKNITKGLLMASTNRIIDANGNDLGVTITATEAFAKMLGFRTHKEIDLWDGVLSIQEQKQVEKDIIDNMNKQWVNISKLIGKDPKEVSRRMHSMSSLFTILEGGGYLSPDAIQRIQSAVLNKDLKNAQAGQDSLLAELWKFNSDEVTGNMKKLEMVIQSSKNPEIKEWYRLWKNKDGL